MEEEEEEEEEEDHWDAGIADDGAYLQVVDIAARQSALQSGTTRDNGADVDEQAQKGERCKTF